MPPHRGADLGGDAKAVEGAAEAEVVARMDVEVLDLLEKLFPSSVLALFNLRKKFWNICLGE